LVDAMSTDVKALHATAQKTKLDGADGISKSEYDAMKASWKSQPQSDATVKWLQKDKPALYAALTSDLDYSGYTGTAIGSLNSTRAGDELKADSRRRDEKLDKLPASDKRFADESSKFGDRGLPKDFGPGDNFGKDDNGNTVWKFQKGDKGNTTLVKGDQLQPITDAEKASGKDGIGSTEARDAREAQKNYAAKMAGVTGVDVTNPPSLNAAKGYFQTLADRGASPKEIQSEYQQYLKTFYRHPGGVNWEPKLDPKDSAALGRSIEQQPVARDGKRLVDCEGFAALTENVMGGIKKKDGSAMFETKCAANNAHIVCGVYPKGGDPRDGFVVDNDQVRSLRPPARFDEMYNATKTDQTKKEWLLKRDFSEQQGGLAPTTYGEFGAMQPPGQKVKMR
jgi:hypothetical protein